MAGLAPGTTKNISKTKLQAFSIGQMNLTKKKSKRVEDELKKKEQEKETAKIFEEFVASFEGTPSTSKSFIRGNTINPETKVEKSDGKTGKLYKPTSKIAESVYAKQQRAIEEAQKARSENQAVSQKAKLKKEKEREKQKKSNLELFKEELRVLQQEREERHKLRKARGGNDDVYDEPILPTPTTSSSGSSSEIRLPAGIEEYSYGSHDYGDPNTTNIFLGSINPKMNEEMLCKEFVQYGPLASVKIMWPRTDAERQRNRNCGFVAFMNRRDAERAMRALNGKEIMNYEMKLGWGKAVVLPPHPVYIPEAMMELTMPPPPSGLPFNAQLKKSSKREVPQLPPPGIALTLEEEGELQETLKEAVVKVVIPTERPLLQVIHRMIEFVVNEGPMFEAMIMNREINNPMFRFLFDNQTPAHVYYRWKLFSILQGDSITKWSTDEFYMFKDGSTWRPPPINPYQQGMPDSLAPRHAITKPPQALPEPPKKKMLTNHQRDKLEDMLRAITMDRYKIGETMVYCLDHADSAEEIVECVAESLSILETPLPKKIGRLFLVSDILFNSSSKVANASFFRKYFENHLPVIMQDVRETYKGIQQRLKAEQFKQRVMACFRSWEDWAVYPNEFLVRLQNIFLGFLDHDTAKEDIQIKDPDALAQPEVDLDGVPLEESSKKDKRDDADFDGVPLEDDQDLDGAPLPTEGGEDLDGAPIDGDPIDGAPLQEEEDDDQRSFTSSGGLKASDDGKGFKVAPSKWETVDSSLLEAQAMTTSKWETLAEEEEEEQEQEEQNEEEEMEEREENDEDGEDVQTMATDFYKSSEMDEIKRAKLREIEVKVMKFQDDVESGRRSRKKDMTMQEQVERYRQKLLQKEKDKEAERQRSKNKDRERDRLKEFERARERERERFSKEMEGSSEEEEMMPVSSSRRDRDRKRRRSRSRSSSPGKRNRSRSPSSRRSNSRKASPDSLAVLREYSDSPSSRSHRSGSRSPKRSTPSHRSRSPKKSRRSRSRSRSPRRRRSPSPSSRRSQRSRSRSPHRRSSSHKKKSKH